MTSFSTRIFLGCVAGAIAVLAFHQTALQIFFWLGLAPHAAFRIAQVPPFHAPMVASITFWGAIYGGVFGWVAPRLKGPLCVNGLAAGVCAMLLSWFVVRPLAGNPIAFGWQTQAMLQSFVACELWGFGLGLILPMMLPRRLCATRSSLDQHRLAA
jgi:hypothetical protein